MLLRSRIPVGLAGIQGLHNNSLRWLHALGVDGSVRIRKVRASARNLLRPDINRGRGRDAPIKCEA